MVIFFFNFNFSPVFKILIFLQVFLAHMDNLSSLVRIYGRPFEHIPLLCSSKSIVCRRTNVP